MLRAFVAWFVLWCVFLFLLTKLRAMKQDDANSRLPRVRDGLAAMILASLSLAVFVMVF